jgi:hypothetical protein
MKFSLSPAPHSLAVALGALALAAPAAVATPADLHAPNATAQTQVTVDLRSPDARDAATPESGAPGATQAQKARMAKAQALAWPHGFVVPTTRVRSPAPRVQSTDDGFDWGSAGVGAAAVGGLILLGVGGFGAAYRARVRLAR